MQAGGLVRQFETIKQESEYKFNPHKLSQEDEDKLKVEWKHLELSFYIAFLVMLVVLLPSFLIEMFCFYKVRKWYTAYREWDRKWLLRHGIW